MGVCVMATNKERLQVRLAPSLMEEVRQLQAALSMTDSAVGSMLIAIGMKQCKELGLIERGATSAAPTAIVARPRKERKQQPDMPKEDASFGFRPKGEHEEHDGHEGSVVRWVSPAGSMTGL
jgi:hypothetical protein